MRDSKLNRRGMIKSAGLIGIGAMSVPALASSVVTPPQTEGPFYPVSDRQDKDVDLTQVAGRSQTALGEPVWVTGRVLDSNGRPLSGAIVDVWQACDSGRYDHPQDPNRAQLDQNFQYFARLKTDNQGRYRFKTIIPGAYPATDSWSRPPHIHFRVDAWGQPRLTTQMYFKGHKLNNADLILKDTEARYGRNAKESLIVDFTKNADGESVGVFDIVLGKTASTDK